MDTQALIDYLDDRHAPPANNLVPSANVIVVHDQDEIPMIRRTDNGNWAVSRVRIAARIIRSALHPLRPRSCWQVWLSAAAVPLMALIIGVGLRLIFHNWPQFDIPSAVGTASSTTLVGIRQSLALRRRRARSL